jgi:hypothetical protein
LDLAFLLAPVLLAVWPWAGLASLGGVLALAFTLRALWLAETEGLHLPRAWVLGVVLTPFSAALAVGRGAWQLPSGRVGERRRSLRFRAGASVILVLLAALPWLPTVADYPQRAGLATVEGQAQSYLQGATLKAVAAFAAARGLNAAISTLQGSSVTVGVGVSGNLALGEVLDPLNDLVERFSEVMLISSVALGLQQLLLPLGLWVGTTLLLPVGIGCFLGAIWLGRGGGDWLAGLGWRVLVAALVVWLLVPVAAGVGSTVFERFLADRYQQSAATIQAAQQQAEALEEQVPEQPAGAGEGWWQRLGLDRLDLRARIQAITQRAEAAVHSLIELTVIFLFQTVVLPLGTLWILLRIGGVLMRGPRAIPLRR